MKKNRSRKRAFTLLEIMIVIFLIGLIGSVIGVNMKGNMEKGKVFKTEQAMVQIEDVLTLLLAENEITPEQIKADFVECLKKSNLVKSAETLSKDGWNEQFIVTINKKQEIRVKSEKFREYLKKQNKTSAIEAEEEKDKEEAQGH